MQHRLHQLTAMHTTTLKKAWLGWARWSKRSPTGPRESSTAGTQRQDLKQPSPPTTANETTPAVGWPCCSTPKAQKSNKDKNYRKDRGEQKEKGFSIQKTKTIHKCPFKSHHKTEISFQFIRIKHASFKPINHDRKLQPRDQSKTHPTSVVESTSAIQPILL